ncbi:mitogen-activated protein kinase-binding protein 1 isoform X1 [Melia azedarach]|uniref:Mitogen-activated protein kinase-binding protein 1 isoform X1 n=1 Tax=Melia azedarach TaxID=155640 RepID=A0ACC1WZ89_MELAZ|nr:mitogen-activated protein kinase-binding protein 1 isoform X1 [Melia azedarach]
MKPNRKIKKSESSSKLILEEIIGLTTRNCNGLASSTSTPKCAYVAGCVVVVYDVDSNAQSHIMVSHRVPRPLSCVAVSRDGRFLAAGESGLQPAVLVWDCETRAFISELKGHLYGVECIAFSPDGEHLVSVGGYIYLWNWRSGQLVTKLKANSSCSAITSVSFSSDGKFIVTAGKKHLKFWTLGSSPRTRLNKSTESLTIHAKPVNLGIQKGSSFVSVLSATWTDNNVVNHKQIGEGFAIYALTDAGILYIVNSGLSVTKLVDLKVEKGFALSTSEKLIACACSNGAVQLFTIRTVKYARTLNYFEAKKCDGENDIVCEAKTTAMDFQLAPTLPDAIACQFSTPEKLVVVYGDHSLYIWDIHNVNEATRCCVLVSHSACIWDIKNLCCENMHDPSLACVARGCSGGVSFSTCSADGTIRLWDLALQPDSSKDVLDQGSLNIEPVSTARLVSAGIFERDTMETTVSTQGFRSIAVSSDGKYLAAGDFAGNLHIYDLKSSEYTCFKDCHDAEILSLSFSLSSKQDNISKEVMDSHYFLASGGRDRTIHLYDVKRNFDLVESIDDHSAAVTSVKFTCNGCKILSCSADRSLVFRDVAATNGAYKVSRRHQQLASHGTVYDMDIDPTMEVVITVGQDKKINSFNITAGKLIRSFKQDKDFGDPIKVTMDPSGSYLVCSYSNKSICLYDFISGEMVSQAMGHGEVITGVTFLPDCKHIVSVGGDGCIFVWKVPAHLALRMMQRVKENYGILSPTNLDQPVALSEIIFYEEEDEKCRMGDMSFMVDFNQVGRGLHYDGEPQVTSTFKFSISRLPKWAQEKVSSSDIIPRNLDFTSSQQVEPEILSPLVGDGVGYASVCHEIQTPSNYDLGDSNSCLSTLSRSSSDAYKSQSSPLPQEAVSSFALDKRWLTVYTVCMDLLNSPEVQSLKDVKMPLSSLRLSKGPLKIPSHGECSSRHDGHRHGATTNRDASPNKIGFLGKNNDQYEMKSLSACNENVAHMEEQPYSGKNKVQESIDANNICHMKSEDSDLFKQHFSSLSTTHAVEKRKSTVRRRFSSQYVVRRDYSGDSKRLFDTPIKNYRHDTLHCGDKSASHVKSANVAFQVKDSFKQDLKNLNESLLGPNHAPCPDEITKVPVKENSMDKDLEEATDNKKCYPESSEALERITECKEALVNLDTAAKCVVQLFSKLGTPVSREELSTGPAAQLYKEAGELLPSIAEKINAVAKAVQYRNNDSSGIRETEVSRFEPILGTFAESLSQKVVEKLKHNLSDA